MDEDARTKHGAYESLEEAQQVCKAIVDACLEEDARARHVGAPATMKSMLRPATIRSSSGRAHASPPGRMPGSVVRRCAAAASKTADAALQAHSEYDGTPFVGWQAQDNGASVQSALADAITAFAGERVAVAGAGRTDAGVHAFGQVAHVDLAKEWDNDNVRDAINFHLRPAADRRADGGTGRARLRRALFRDQAALSLSHRQSPRRSDARLQSRLARAAPA